LGGGGNPTAPDYGDPRYAVGLSVMVFILLVYRFFTGFIAHRGCWGWCSAP